MTDLLVKVFVKNWENSTDSKVRSAYGILSSVTGVVCNLVLFAVKLLTGLALGSISVISDAFNNLSDAASSIISFLGVKLAERPADKEHPYGHGRMEYIAALAVALLILEVGWTFCKTSIDKIRHPQDLTFQAVGLILLLLSILVKLWMASFNRKLGERINSKVMQATAADSLGDVLATSATILALLLYRILGINIDGWIGLLVSVIILIAGIGILRDTLEPLIGEYGSEEEKKRITEIVERHQGIYGSHDLLIHHYGPAARLASIHAEMDGHTTVEEAHRMIDHIERQIKRELGISIVIHVDPVETTDPESLACRRLVKKEIKAMSPDMKMHDFQLMIPRNSDQKTCFFDLVVPYDMDEQTIEEIRNKLRTSLMRARPELEFNIEVERDMQ